MNAADVKTQLRRAANSEKAKLLAGFFKTGKGQYGEGDRFLGVMVPQQRKIAKAFLSARPPCAEALAAVRELLRGAYHEERFTGLAILVDLYKKSAEPDRKRIYDFYFKNQDGINSWDLVDVSAPRIVGAYLLGKDPSILYTLVESDRLWTRRVAVLATFAFIDAGQFDHSLRFAERLLIEKQDGHDLMHKAVGWMLREVGKRDERVLAQFLDRFAPRLPRTALRYAIERFPEPKRQHYLRMRSA